MLASLLCDKYSNYLDCGWSTTYRLICFSSNCNV